MTSELQMVFPTIGTKMLTRFFVVIRDNLEIMLEIGMITLVRY